MTDEDVTVLLCAAKGTYQGPIVEGSVEETCVDCGVAILRKPDPEVPEDAVYLCLPCGFARIDASDEVPELIVTKQNKEMLDKLGYVPRVDGSC
jgi:predicted RNA-binding Zn-ribbon protein involved in translation (DUF1610 family)